jgi:hypothetical protein
MLDSVPSSALNDPAMIIGSYFDSQIGNVSASSFFRVGVASARYSIHDSAVFDSLKLFLAYNNYYAGDTTKPFTMTVHRLTGSLKPNDDGYFYNNDSVAAMSEVLGSTTFKPSPHSTDSIWITLDENLGRELFGLMKDNNAKVRENDYFIQYLKGFMVRYVDNDSVILGFKFPKSESSTFKPAMRIFYHYKDENVVNQIYDFKADWADLNSQMYIQFNRITLRNKVFPLPTVQTAKLASAELNNRSLVLGGLGIVTRIEIPYIKNLRLLGDNLQILRAELELQPVRNTYNKIPLPAGINLYTTDDRNRWGTALSNNRGDALTGNLVTDMLYQEDTYYTFDISSFLISKLNEQSDVIPALLVAAAGENLNKTVDRLVLGSQQNTRNKVILKLYFMNVE